MKRYNLLYAIVAVLLITNLATVIYFSGKIGDMRSQSTFKVFADKDNLSNGNESLVNCLHKAMIDYKVDDIKVLVREVDINTATAKCS